MSRIFLFCLLVCNSYSLLASITPLAEFGDNPGNLSAELLLPDEVNQYPALVVLLHGCGQQAKPFARQSGFIEQAHSSKFALLLPQQSQSNNEHLCFNWYNEQDTKLNSGESLSLKNMILRAKQISNSQSVYIAGLSAGGAMTGIMLLHYPELFTAGAIIAGLPFPCANDLEQALRCMKQGSEQTPQQLAQYVKRNSSSYWPRLTIWFGQQDKIVNPVNSAQLAQQWRALLDSQIAQEPSAILNTPDGVSIKQWPNRTNDIQLQLVEFRDIGHGIPVQPALQGGGAEGPYLLAAPMSAAIGITQFWHISG